MQEWLNNAVDITNGQFLGILFALLLAIIGVALYAYDEGKRKERRILKKWLRERFDYVSFPEKRRK